MPTHPITIPSAQEMHHALEVDEILLNIFTHCNALRNPACLVALARTCRMFKEPALSALWRELLDLSPVARCVPEICYQADPNVKRYSFRRRLEQAEWATLLSYTRRVRSILDFGAVFHKNDVRTFLSPPTSEPLFPNLRYLRSVIEYEVTPLLLQPLPWLSSCSLGGNLYGFRDALKLFPMSSPNMRNLDIRLPFSQISTRETISHCICHWSYLQAVYCSRVALTTDAILHLSRMPNLTALSFTTDATSVDEVIRGVPLVFSKLQELALYSESLAPISSILFHIQLPVITDFSVTIVDRPSKKDVGFFMTALQTSATGYSVTMLEFTQCRSSRNRANRELVGSDSLVLAYDDLRPSMAFKNLREINVDLGWHVGLTDFGLLELASAWLHLEYLRINEEWGWQTSGGITPDGLVCLLQTCRSLRRISLAIDSRGYVDVPPLRYPADLGLDPPSMLVIDALDSVIEAASVRAMAVFLATIVPSVDLSFNVWRNPEFHTRDTRRVYRRRWKEVCTRAAEAIALRSRS